MSASTTPSPPSLGELLLRQSLTAERVPRATAAPPPRGGRLPRQSLTAESVQRATEATPDYPILPWVNVVKIGGQSIMDRGRAAVYPLVEGIGANLERHKMRI